MSLELHEGAFGAEWHDNEAQIARRDLEAKPLSPEELELAASYYAAAYEARANGPQLEGLQPENIQGALTDPRTVAIEHATPDGHIVWPLFVPVEHNTEYRPEFFEDHLGEGAEGRTFYYSAPDSEFLPHDTGSDLGLRELAQERAVVVFDYHETEEDKTREHFLQLAEAEKVRLAEPFAGLQVGEQPRVLHFSGKVVPTAPTGPMEPDLHKAFRAKIERGEAEAHPFNGSTILDPHEIATNQDGLADQLWAAYDETFDDLVEDHPSMQKQTREQLMAMLSDPDTVTTAYFKESRVVGFSLFVREIEKCEWLDADFYKKKFPGEELAISSGIVVEKSEEGRAYSLPMIRAFADTAAEANYDGRLIFQCTNVSVQYVPRIVELGINRTDGMHFSELEQTASYKYDVFQLEAGSPPPVSAPLELTAA